MIDKYLVAIVLVISNVLGLTALFKIDNTYNVDLDPPSTVEVLDPHQPEVLDPHQPEVQLLLMADLEPQKVIIDSEFQKTQSKYITHYGITFKHNDITWLPKLASQAGWPEHTWKRLGQIVLRESGGCPNLRGGDRVNKNCVITGVSEWNHRSDTGLVQINGINYNLKRNKWAAVCLQLDICTQDPLLDPLNNLKAAKVLYDISGWDPWDPCAWGPAYKHRCNKTKKP